jgi:hypothetical protein
VEKVEVSKPFSYDFLDSLLGKRAIFTLNDGEQYAGEVQWVTPAWDNPDDKWTINFWDSPVCLDEDEVEKIELVEM